MMSLLWSVDYGSGRVEYIDSELTLDATPDQQRDWLREDLLQVAYAGGRYLLDAGWYSADEGSGAFLVVVIEDFRWDAPIYTRRTAHLADLTRILQEAILWIERKL